MDLTPNFPPVNESAEDTAIVEDSSAAGPSSAPTSYSAASSSAAFAQAVALRPLPASFRLTLPFPRPPSRPLVRQEPFPLFQLPAEIRNMVFGVLLTSEKPIVPHNAQPRPIFNFQVQDAIRAAGPLYDPLPTMLRVSRQFSREAAMVFYSTNTFQLTLTEHRTWLAKITRRNSFLIRHMRIKCYDVSMGVAENMEAWIIKLVYMRNTVRKRCQGLITLVFLLGRLRIGERDAPAAECLQSFLESEAIGRSWITNAMTKLRRISILVNEDRRDTESLIESLKQLARNVPRGVVVEAKHGAWVASYKLPGASPDDHRWTHRWTEVYQERKFFERRYDDDTRTVVIKDFPWEIPVGWPTVYRDDRWVHLP